MSAVLWVSWRSRTKSSSSISTTRATATRTSPTCWIPREPLWRAGATGLYLKSSASSGGSGPKVSEERKPLCASCGHEEGLHGDRAIAACGGYEEITSVAYSAYYGRVTDAPGYLRCTCRY